MAEVCNTWQRAIPATFGAGREPVRALVGWGGLALLDAGVHVVSLLRAYLQAVQEESCGRCVPCRLGSKIIGDTLDRIAEGGGLAEDLERMEKLAVLARDGSLCELGQSFPVPLLDALRERREEFRQAIRAQQPLPPAGFRVRKLVSAPCLNRCPAHLDVPRYVQKVAEGDFEQALAAIREKTFLAGVLGRVCGHVCESNCRRNCLDEPLSIRGLQRFAGDHRLAWRKGVRRAESRAERVAVVGAGPAGLSAAYQLARRGYPVTVLEAGEEAGGMLAQAIPAYRLPREVLRRETALLAELGVEFRFRTALGRDVTLAALREEFPAVLVATGLPLDRPLTVEGAQLAGVRPGLDTLRRVNRGEAVDLGSRVAVLGEGHLALDCARVARRLGAAEVYLVTERERDALLAGRVGLAEAEAEGVRLLDGVTVECLRGEAGRVRAVVYRRAGQTGDVPVETVIAAPGQEPDRAALPQGLLDAGGKIAADPRTMQTSLPGVFAAGEAVHGEASVVRAVAAGNRAAESVDRYLRLGEAGGGEEEDLQELAAALAVYDPAEKVAALANRPRAAESVLPAEERVKGWDEVNRGLPHQAALQEAARCLRCYRLAIVVS